MVEGGGLGRRGVSMSTMGSFLTNSSTHNWHCLGWQDLEDLERKFKDAMPQQGQVRGGGWRHEGSKVFA